MYLRSAESGSPRCRKTGLASTRRRLSDLRGHNGAPDGRLASFNPHIRCGTHTMLAGEALAKLFLH